MKPSVGILLVGALFACQAIEVQAPKTLIRERKGIQLETAYVVRKNAGRKPHYAGNRGRKSVLLNTNFMILAVIVGSSGKTVVGPALPEPREGEVHKVEGFIIKNDNVVETAGDVRTFARSALITHNQYRMRHHAPKLRWSDKLASQAQQIASKLLKEEQNNSRRNRIDSNDADTVGENVEKFTSVEYGCDRAGFEATRRWYSQGDNYSYNYPHITDQTNSFTQLVWKDSQYLGMGCASRRGLLTNDIYVVALYSPPGNVGNAVTRNVIKPGDGPSSSDLYSSLFKRR